MIRSKKKKKKTMHVECTMLLLIVKADKYFGVCISCMFSAVAELYHKICICDSCID